MITAEIIEVETNENDSIIFWIAFDVKGTEKVWTLKGVPQIRKGRNVWPLYSGIQNFISKTLAERRDWLQKNMEYQIDSIITGEVRKILTPTYKTDLSSFIGTVFSKDKREVSVNITTDGSERVIILKDDGTFVLK